MDLKVAQQCNYKILIENNTLKGYGNIFFFSVKIKFTLNIVRKSMKYCSKGSFVPIK